MFIKFRDSIFNPNEFVRFYYASIYHQIRGCAKSGENYIIATYDNDKEGKAGFNYLVKLLEAKE